MSRKLKDDFSVLLDFIEKYNLSNIVDVKFKIFLSQMHKKYYALIAFVNEIDKMDNEKKNPIIKDKQKDFLFENVSDIGNAIFLTINGAYKASKIMLRCSIENFLKGISISELHNIDREKRIYQMFDDISKITFFNIEPNKTLFNNLKILYSELSKAIHTAGIEQMQHISSLNYFPTKSFDKLTEISKIIVKLSSIYLTLLSFKFNKEYHSMYYENKKIIITNIEKRYRQKIQNIGE